MLDSWKDHSSMDHASSSPWRSSLLPSEPSLSRSSASSVVISPSNAASSQEAPASSESSGSVLKEHDYIGLAEVSSASVVKQAAGSAAGAAEYLNLEETDLRLGLGPVKESPVPAKLALRAQDIHSSVELKRSELAEAVVDADSRKEVVWPERPQVLKPEWSIADAQRAAADPQQRNGGQETKYTFVEGAAAEQRSLQTVWQVREFPVAQIPIQGHDFEAPPRPAVLNSFAGAVIVPAAKNGIKRVYSEAMAEVARGESKAGVSVGTTGAAMVMKNAMQAQEAEVKAMPKIQQGAFLSTWKAAGVAYGGMASSKGVPRAEKAGEGAAVTWEPRSKPQEHTIAKDTPRHTVLDSQEAAANEPPPSKGQVVGWPPIRSYRRNTLAAHPKPAGEEGDGQSIFVKVNMDGIPIGRKVDLNAHTCYEGLLFALEEMFQRAQGAPQTVNGRDAIPNDIKQLRLLNSSEFVLTYEDKEGDWMLVGDVPWGMFVNTVRRLRIMRGSEATGLSPRGPGKPKGHI